MSSRQSSHWPRATSEQPPRNITSTPNLIARVDARGDARGDGTTNNFSEQSQLPIAYSEDPRSWSNSSPFATQLETGYPRDRLRSRPAYEQPLYPVTNQPGSWGPGDPRYPQRLDQSGPSISGQPQSAYQYQQHPLQYPDPRFGRDVNYYAGDIAPGQPYPHIRASYESQQQSRFRQSNYHYMGGPPLTYDQPQSAYAVPQSPVRMQPADFPQAYARQAPPRAMTGNAPFIPVGAPQYGHDTRTPPTEPTPSYPRGPPRKPKQSGFAVWVGNLSPGTTILDLKDYFSRGATNDIESVFLISKSNCAFVNYKTADSAQAAVSRFHDSRFNGARLVCRLRHGQAPTTTTPPLSGNRNQSDGSAPTVEASLSGPAVPNEVPTTQVEPETQTPAPAVEITAEDRPDEGVSKLQIVRESVGPQQQRVLERYFIVKSLTLQDLEASVRDGIWATQSHNESALREAFESAQDVYLIFSANKSGEYFGYARMKSNINPSAVTANPKAEPSTPALVDGPTSTPTLATEHAPKGRVVDDSARGTIFWEADSSSGSDGEEDDVGEKEEVHNASPEKPPSRPSQRRPIVIEDPAKQDWGRPFEIEWLSTSRLPFYRTRGLRNPWNANREVKIARDGTELEPSVGRRLLELLQQTIHNPTSTSSFTYQMPEGPVVAMGSAYTASDRGQSSS
ncbi:hypothetical protein KVT40_008141 [Elsinoe batatas]|uniref:YTH domain-containing protein n=1 Tax=Elsinoe batatas TaxID=2601811 RepID=A0A8K0KTS8_9PEZI|nr:hypothetical protein KVT40_008141 [Elsinoe batatas]